MKDNKNIIGIVCGILLIGIICIVIVINNGGGSNTGDESGSTNNELIGKYELKEATYGEDYYTPETMKKELARTMTLEITKDKFVITSTYYGPEGQQSNSKEVFTYDDDKLYDSEAGGDAFYHYGIVDGVLIIKSLTEPDMIAFIKK